MAIKVAIVIPSRNRPVWLQKSLEIASRQWRTDEGTDLQLDISIVLADATSVEDHPKRTEEAWNSLWQVIENLESLQTIVTVPKATCGTARNAGCRKALEDKELQYIVHWNDDDWYSVDRVLRQVEFLENNKQYEMVGCGRSYGYEPATGRAFDLDFGDKWAPSGSWCMRARFCDTHPFFNSNQDEIGWLSSHRIAKPSISFIRNLPGILVSMFHFENSEVKQLGMMKEIDSSIIANLPFFDKEFFSNQNFTPSETKVQWDMATGMPRY